MAEEMVLEHAAFSGLVDRRSGEIALEGAALSGGDRCADEIGFHIRPVTVPDTPLQLALKRTIDAAAASLGLVVLAPVLAVAAVLIRLDSKGPILVRQLQTGLNEVPFEHLSFRCEYENRESGNRRANLQANGPRLTRFGRALRRSGLDRLPQLWNVLAGDMSLVGPAPHVPDMLAAGYSYDQLVQGYEYRNLMRPGLTGLAQAHTPRGPTEHRAMAIRRIIDDVEYIRNFSLLMDAKIISRTMINAVKGSPAL